MISIIKAIALPLVYSCLVAILAAILNHGVAEANNRGVGAGCNMQAPWDSQESNFNDQEVIERQQFPWFDAQSDASRFVEPNTSSVDSSALRESVAPIVPSRLPNWTWNWNWLPGWTFWQTIFWALILLVVIVLGIVLFRLFVSRQSSSSAPSLRRATKLNYEDQIKDLPFQLDTRTGDCRQLAANAYSTGDYSRAIVYLFSHSLLFMDRFEVLRLQRGKTNRQYLRESRTVPQAGEYFSQLILPFESVFFGGHTIDRQQFEQYWNELTTFEHSVSAYQREAK